MFFNYTIGIIGGGQLGKMLAIEAFKKGLKVAVLDPDENAPALEISHFKIVSDFFNKTAIEKLIKITNVITYEFENVEADLLNYYRNFSNIHPNPEILKIAKNRILEKQLAQKFGITIPSIFPIYSIKNNPEEIKNIYQKLKQTDKNWIIKKSEGGYDGKYQISFIQNESFENFYKLLQNFFHASENPVEVIIEEKIDFDFEFSIIACGYKNSNQEIEVKFYKPFLNIHKNGILRKTFSFLDFELNVSSLQEKIKNIIQEYNYIGILTLEFFFKNNIIYFNEMAPRVHNSGHLSIEGYNYSQFEQHIRAITNFPILEPELKTNAGMLNLISYNNLETNPALLQEILKIKNCYFHYYGKKEPKQNRKMGHISLLNNDKEQLIQTINFLEKKIYDF